MFWRSPLCDLILIAMVFSIVRRYVFEKGLSEYEKRYIQHSQRWIRNIAILIVSCGIFCSVGCDMGIVGEEYYIYGLFAAFIVIYFFALWAIYVDYQYGPKNHCFTKNLKRRILSAIALPCCYLLLYIFMGK